MRTGIIDFTETDRERSRRNFLKKFSLGALGLGILGNKGFSESSRQAMERLNSEHQPSKVKITGLKCAVIGDSPVVRITTDVGIDGLGQVERSKPYLKPMVLFYKDYLIGEDPTNISRIMLKIRRMGSFKPWGSAVSAIEMALWDLSGKIAGLPVYRLMGGKMRDQVRCYNGSVPLKLPPGTPVGTPKGYLAAGESVKKLEQGFTIVKTGMGFHSQMPTKVPNFYYGNTTPSASPKNVNHPYRGLITEYGLKYMIDCVAAMKEGLGDGIGLAVDCGPGFVLSDAIRLANALEPFNLMWLEDALTGDYTPYVMAGDYRELTRSTTVPIHTGEQLYLRENFRELVDKQAVRVLGPDPADIGGIGELKWVAEYADMHGILIAPHGTLDGLIGLAAEVQVAATLPENYIAFEYPYAQPQWWYDIIEGLPDPIVKGGLIDVWDRPGLGVTFNIKAAKQYLSSEDKDFFD